MFKTVLITLALVGSSSTGIVAEDTAPSPSEVFGQKMLVESNQRNRNRNRNRNRAGPAQAQVRMAAKAGFAPSQYSHAQLATIVNAQGSAFTSDIEVAMNKVNGERPMPVSHVSAGEAALGKLLGLDPRDYSLSELVKLKMATDF